MPALSLENEIKLRDAGANESMSGRRYFEPSIWAQIGYSMVTNARKQSWKGLSAFGPITVVEI